ncbi:MFS-type transporter [Sphaerulina musiva]
MTRSTPNRPGNQSQTSFFDSRVSSEKSSPGASRSQSKTREDAEWLERPERRLSIDSEKNEKATSPAPGPNSRTIEIQTPPEPVRLQSLATLSVASERQPHSDDEPTWPTDWRAYTCLFGGFLLMFNSWGLVNTYGTYASYYMQNLLPGRDILLLNLVGSTQSFVVLLLSAPVGRFLDAGYSRTLMIVGTIFVTLGSFLLSVVNGDGEYNQGNYGLIWLTQGFLTGLGMSCFFVTSSQVVSTWFKAKKGFAIGIVASGASISGLLYPMMTKFLIQKHGFNIATRYVATVVCLTACLATVLATPNPKHIIRKPESWFKISVFVDTNAFRNRSYTWFVASIAFLFFGFYAVFFNLEEWAVSEGFGYRASTGSVGINSGLPHLRPQKSMEAFWLLAIMNATSTLGRVTSSYFCDHFGALNVHCLVTTVASLLTIILWTLAKNLSSAIGFVVVFGAFSGAVIGLPPASVAYILGPDPKAQAKLGQWTGMMYSCAAIFALTGPVIAGHLISEYSTFITVQCWAGGCMFMSACCMGCAIFCRERTKKYEARLRQQSTCSSSAPMRPENEKELV